MYHLTTLFHVFLSMLCTAFAITLVARSLQTVPGSTFRWACVGMAYQQAWLALDQAYWAVARFSVVDAGAWIKYEFEQSNLVFVIKANLALATAFVLVMVYLTMLGNEHVARFGKRRRTDRDEE